jgi:hypothetical protein
MIVEEWIARENKSIYLIIYNQFLSEKQKQILSTHILRNLMMIT